MDGSLASIFMNSASVQSTHCGHNEWSALDTSCPEELQYKLICASMELQRAKAAAQEEEKIQEAKLHHLQELLTILMKERDEARDECKKLRERLSQPSSSSADSPCRFMNSSLMVSSPSPSPSSSPWSLQELEEHLNSDNFCDFAKAPPPLELQHTLQSFSQSCNDEHGLQALFSIEPTCESILEDSESPFSLDMLEQGSPFVTDPSLNLVELEQSKVAIQGVCESSQSTRSLSRQSSSNSSSASVQMYQLAQNSMDLTDAIAPSLSPVKIEGVDVGADTCMPFAMCNNASLPVTSSTSSRVLPLTGNLAINSSPPLPPSNPTICAEGAPGVKTTPLNMQAYSSPSPPNVSLASKQANTTIMRQVHLPEPPEADPKVMLSSLPEKGKLLQAVMQAGPLLQTLLLAGPLPQWRHPPPALSTGDIPKVSMLPSSSNVILPYPHASMVQGHVKYLAPANNAASSSATRVRGASADSCTRPKKLRKLSPASPHQSPLMHMWSGEGRVPVGVVSYPPTIY